MISSDYENLSNKPSPVRESSFSNQQHTTSQHQQHQQVTNIAVKKSAIINSPQKSFNFNTNIPVKSYSYDKQRMQSSDNLSGGVTSFTPNRTTIPQSQSYIISPNYAKGRIQIRIIQEICHRKIIIIYKSNSFFWLF